MNWAIDVLSPLSQSDMWERASALNILSVLSAYGATPHIKQISATVLANGVGGVA